jgi:hypothetical protein
VAIWNSRAARKARTSFYPTIETAVLAGMPYASRCQSPSFAVTKNSRRQLKNYGPGNSKKPPGCPDGSNGERLLGA